MAEMYQPTLVIGLGGTGKKIILALKKMIAENCEHGMADFPFLKVLSVDTDRALPHTQSSIKTVKDEALSLNANREIFQLQAGFSTIPDFNDYPEIKEWFPPSLGALLMPAELSKGAGQKKPVGRFTFAWNASELFEEINAFIRAPVDVKIAIDKNISQRLSKTINVFICGSLCGGTGSGTFLDTAYLVRYCQRINQGTGYQVKIFGMFALASLFDGVQGTANVRQNCYASLVELDHFMNSINNSNQYRTFMPSYKSFKPDYSDSSRTKPFDYPFMFDNFGKGVALNSQGAFSEMVARFIYLLTGHELSDHWFSMDSNVEATLESTYKKDVYNKPIKYRGMGTFSILYPKRMIVQLCAYYFSRNYVEYILDDSYAPQEIEMLTKNFLKDIKLNPQTNQLEAAFDIFNEPGGFRGSFTDYVENQIADFLDHDIEKASLRNELSDWKKEMEEKVIEFRNLNATRAQTLRESFLSQLKIKLSELLDLHKRKLGIKKDSAGNDVEDRGSLVRAQNVIECLIKLFTEAKEKYRRLRNESESKIRNYKSDFESALSDLDEKADSFFSTKKKLAEAKAAVLDVCRSLFLAEKQSFTADWCYQLFTDILWNDVPKYSGLIKELEVYKSKYQKLILSFKEIDSDIHTFLDNNRRFEPNPLFAVIFDYQKDVVEACTNLLQEKTEDFVFGSLSDDLTREDVFGADYTGAANKTTTLISIDILNATEKFFFEPVNKVNIADRILETQEISDRLEQGTYFEASPIYLGIETSIMDKVGLNFNNSTFFAISIPDEYEGKPCKDIKGVVRASGATVQCPMEQDPEKFKKEPCPMFNHCLKQKLLHNAPGNVAITPTSEISEVNIMHTIAGYPLCSISSVMNGCKSVYLAQKKAQQEENEANGTENEEINMFGPMVFDQLDEKSVDPRRLQNDFKKLLLVAFVARRLRIQPLSLDFRTERDLIMKREDGELHLGDTVDDVMQRFQSSRVSDKKIINQFTKETERLIAEIKTSAKENFASRAKAVFESFKTELPKGFTPDTLELLDAITKELTGTTLIEETSISTLMG